MTGSWEAQETILSAGEEHGKTLGALTCQRGDQSLLTGRSPVPVPVEKREKGVQLRGFPGKLVL